MNKLTLVGAAAALLGLAPVALAPAAWALEAPASIIHAGQLLETPGAAPLSHATLVVIDLSSMFVMPGFIDLHVHLSGTGSGDAMVRKSNEYFTLVGAKNANTTLMAGFTTVRDLGSIGYTVLALRDAIKDGLVPGPKILASGDPISPTDGHADNHGYREEVMNALPRRGVCDGADDCRRAVRAAVKRGADVIKVMASGGTLDESDAPTDQQFTDDELKAIAETAHMLGRKVTAHAHGKGAIDACIRAGFDSIEHAMWADQATLQTMKDKGIWLIPTVYPIDYVGDTPEKVRAGPMRNLPPVSLAKVIALGDQPKKLAKMAHRMGVKIALGTDAGVYPHGQNANEFVEYVEAGMTPMESLIAGTSDAAVAGGIKGVGKLEPGMSADLVALPESPLHDIHAVLNVPFVMRDGIVFKDAGVEKTQTARVDTSNVEDAF
jgi:imidazolonepropionase-like amidohydrolase